MRARRIAAPLHTWPVNRSPMDIELVLPIKTTSGHHKSLLALLSTPVPVGGGQVRQTRVPVLPSEEVTALLQQNEQQAKRRRIGEAALKGASYPQAATGAGAGETTESLAGLSNADDDTDATDDASNFVPLARFLPENRLQQVTTAFYPRFPRLKKQHVSAVFARFLAECPHAGASATFLHLDWVSDDFRGIYVRFPTVEITRWVRANSASVLDPLAVFDSQLGVDDTLANSDGAQKESLEVHAGSLEAQNQSLIQNESLEAQNESLEVQKKSLVKDPQDVLNDATLNSHNSILNSPRLADARNFILSILVNPRNYLTAGKTNTKDLDAVMEYYRTYKVENLDLVEVPKDMKDSIVRDIIRFRSRVLLIERENRKKEIEKERRSAKRRLTKIYESIRSRAGDEPKAAEEKVPRPIDASGNSANPGDPAQEPSVDRESSEALSDAEYEAVLAQKAEAALDAQYVEICGQLHEAEADKSARLATLAELLTYEDDLLENKLSFMDDLKVLETTAPKHVPPALATLALYHTNHREYVRLRNIERANEEAWEAKERLKMALEIPENAPFTPFKSEAKSSLQSAQPNPSPELKSGNPHTSEVTKLNPDSEPGSEAGPDAGPDAKESETKRSGKESLAPIVVQDFSDEKLTGVKNHISSLIEDYLGVKEEVLIDYVYDFVVKHNLEQKNVLVAELSETLDDDSVIVVDLLYDYVKSVARAS